MISETTETHTQTGISPRSVAWVAAAVGAGIGVAAVAYSRRRRSPWDRAKDRANELIDAAKEEVKPWMGVAVGTAAAGTAFAVYTRRRRQSGWQRVGNRAGEMASRVGAQARPWANVAASVAISLASAAYANKARRRIIRGIDESTVESVNSLVERGSRLLQRVRDLSDESRKLYPRVRRVLTT